MRLLGTAVVLAAVFSANQHASAQYTPGFRWDRSADFDAGTVPGSSLGNPNTDPLGNPVWSYETTNAAGGALSAPNPWYAGPTTPMVWDNDWYRRGFGAWAQGDDTFAPVLADCFEHTLKLDPFYERVPVIRWVNPVATPFRLNVFGSLTADWFCDSSQAVDLETVIAMVDQSAGTITPLFSHTFVKPHDNLLPEVSLPEAVDLRDIYLEPGDAIIVSSRGARAAQWTAIDTLDNLTFEVSSTPVPEPSSLVAWGGLLACLIGLAVRRRCRK